MRWDNIYLAGLGAYFPEETLTAEQAIAAGDYDAAAAEKNGVRAVRVATAEETGPVMAAAAGRQALARSGHASQEIDLVLHAYTNHPGRELWTPAHFVQQETLGHTTAAAIEMRQGCNGVLGGLELAASWIAARPDATAALVTCGDAWQLPYIDRWRSDDQTVFGDGAVATVLSTRSGFAKVRSTVSRSDASLEPLYRGMGPWTQAPFADGKTIDLGSRPGDWLLRNEDAYDEVLEVVSDNFMKTLDQAFADADTSLDEVQWFIHGTVIKPIAEWGFYQKLGLDPAKTTYDWGLDFGHMGSSDQFLGINHLIESRKAKPGDLIATVGVGIGFMWTAAVLEVVDVPDWSN
ncbi:ketoacyl-ACP synthase III family protein [Streptomyces sp. FH025]|uniref:ketoacyl-ACP synthase III family protein n=1 Tax=Streptomyces sp. FH025 TaxID=2815937 RepID=UPI001A9FE9A4|nr:ketoacyl-ACP synthase III family protein [Streptomyces sp. FH025]MBO1416429.1 ketoacyl-ACP synthase III family protein [Streptomyces sp. FH025]